MIFSDFSIQELSRVLGVSKYFRQRILKSIKPARTLFIKPVQPKEFCEMKTGTDPRFYLFASERLPVIVNKPSLHSQMIVQPHPILQSFNAEPATGLLIRRNVLGTVPPDTLLSQPPLPVAFVRHGQSKTHTRRPEWLTAGAVLEELDKINSEYDADAKKPPNERILNGPFYNSRLGVDMRGAIRAESLNVAIARNAQMVKQLYARKDGMHVDVFDLNKRQLLQREHAVNEAGFRRWMKSFHDYNNKLVMKGEAPVDKADFEYNMLRLKISRL